MSFILWASQGMVVDTSKPKSSPLFCGYKSLLENASIWKRVVYMMSWLAMKAHISNER